MASSINAQYNYTHSIDIDYAMVIPETVDNGILIDVLKWKTKSSLHQEAKLSLSSKIVVKLESSVV